MPRPKRPAGRKERYGVQNLQWIEALVVILVDDQAI